MIPTCTSDIVAVSDSFFVICLVRTSDAVAVSDKLRVKRNIGALTCSSDAVAVSDRLSVKAPSMKFLCCSSDMVAVSDKESSCKTVNVVAVEVSVELPSEIKNV